MSNVGTNKPWCQLELPTTWKIHPLFHVALLEPYRSEITDHEIAQIEVDDEGWVFEIVAGTVRKGKSDIVRYTLAVTLNIEWKGHIGRSAIGRTWAQGWADFQYSHSVITPPIQKSKI